MPTMLPPTHASTPSVVQAAALLSGLTPATDHGRALPGVRAHPFPIVLTLSEDRDGGGVVAEVLKPTLSEDLQRETSHSNNTGVLSPDVTLYMVSSRCRVGECRSGDGDASDDSECSERDVSAVRVDSDASSLPGGVRHVRQNSSRPSSISCD